MSKALSDLELLNKVCEDPVSIHPFLFREVEGRGLYQYIDYLPSDADEARAVVYARLAKDKKVFGNPEIDAIAGLIDRLKVLRKGLNKFDIVESEDLKPILDEMVEVNNQILNYFKRG